MAAASLDQKPITIQTAPTTTTFELLGELFIKKEVEGVEAGGLVDEEEGDFRLWELNVVVTLSVAQPRHLQR